MEELAGLDVQDGRPQDGDGGGHPDRVLVGARRAVRRQGVDQLRLEANQIEVGLRRDQRSRPLDQGLLRLHTLNQIYQCTKQEYIFAISVN